MTEQEAMEVLKQPCLCDYDLSKTVLDCDIKQCDKRDAVLQAIKALEEICQYREIKERLKAVYGECDGLLETAIDQAVENAVSILEKHEGIDIGDPYKSRLLTDEDVDKWESYKAIGTPDECRSAVEEQKDIIRKAIDGFAKWLENKKYLMKEIQEHDFCYTHYNELKANCVTTEYLAEQVKAGDEE